MRVRHNLPNPHHTKSASFSLAFVPCIVPPPSPSLLSSRDGGDSGKGEVGVADGGSRRVMVALGTGEFGPPWCCGRTRVSPLLPKKGVWATPVPGGVFGLALRAGSSVPPSAKGHHLNTRELAGSQNQTYPQPLFLPTPSPQPPPEVPTGEIRRRFRGSEGLGQELELK